MIQTKQQQRAKFALDETKKIQTVEKEGKKLVPEKLANKIVGMPNMILSNGLGQSLAFLLSKKKNDKSDKDQPEEVQIFNILKNWFNSDVGKTDKVDASSDMKLLETINELSSQKYIEAQDEVLRMLEWLKRYARAFSEK